MYVVKQCLQDQHSPRLLLDRYDNDQWNLVPTECKMKLLSVGEDGHVISLSVIGEPFVWSASNTCFERMKYVTCLCGCSCAKSSPVLLICSSI